MYMRFRSRKNVQKGLDRCAQISKDRRVMRRDTWPRYLTKETHMKKLLITVLTAGALTLPSMADFYVAGDFNGWNAAGNLMTETSTGSGIWQVSLASISAGRHEFKVTDGTWTWNYPGANSWLFPDGSGNITITYDGNTYSDGWSPTSQRIGLSFDPGSWTAAGNFQVAAGEASDWNNAAGNMTAMGGGIYRYQLSTPGTWKWKAVVTGSWDSISWDNRSVGTADWEFTIGAGEVANLYVNAFAGMAMVVIPEPSTFALLSCALAGLFCLRRRQ